MPDLCVQPEGVVLNSPLADCRRSFGVAPRKFSLSQRMTYLRIPRPQWLLDRSDDHLSELFNNLDRLYAEGVVVWGCVIDANGPLFDKGKDDCTGELVYSIDKPDHENLDELQEVAKRVFRMKETRPRDADMASIARHISNESSRVFGAVLPEELSPNMTCRVSSTYFVRKHLPKRRLCGDLMPIIVSPAAPYIALPLPGKFWPSEVTDWWTRG
jgi:hypothetical protein